VDSRNHGESPSSEVVNYTVLADDLLEFLHYRQLEKATLIGHSVGGKSAMCLALREPRLVDRFVAIDAVPNLKRSIEHMESIVKAVNEFDIKKFMTVAEADMEEVFKRKPTEGFVRRMLSGDQSQSGIFKFNALNILKTLRETNLFPKFDTTYPEKALFIIGSKSDTVVREKEIKSFFPAAEIAWVDAGHSVHFEKPEEVTELVVQFLSS
jgi:abhydrolase domain-containing protein 11